jgi:hypothetical protein
MLGKLKIKGSENKGVKYTYHACHDCVT